MTSTCCPSLLLSFVITTLSWVVNRWETRNSISILLLSYSDQASLPSTSWNCLSSTLMTSSFPKPLGALLFIMLNFSVIEHSFPSDLFYSCGLQKAPFSWFSSCHRDSSSIFVCRYLLGSTFKWWDSPELSHIYNYSPLKLFHLVLWF